MHERIYSLVRDETLHIANASAQTLSYTSYVCLLVLHAPLTFLHNCIC